MARRGLDLARTWNTSFPTGMWLAAYVKKTHTNSTKVRGGALVALFFLPAGRISYTATPDMPQPHCV
jgi:hypothetical protein